MDDIEKVCGNCKFWNGRKLKSGNTAVYGWCWEHLIYHPSKRKDKEACIKYKPKDVQ